MLGSEAGLVIDRLRDDLLFAGVPVSDARTPDYWPVFAETVESVIDALETSSQ